MDQWIPLTEKREAGFLEKSFKFKFALESTGKLLKT